MQALSPTFNEMVSSEAVPSLQVLDHVVLKPLHVTRSPAHTKGSTHLTDHKGRLGLGVGLYSHSNINATIMTKIKINRCSREADKNNIMLDYFKLYIILILKKQYQTFSAVHGRTHMKTSSGVREIISPAPHPPNPFTPSPISLMVCMDVKHHVYLLT